MVALDKIEVSNGQKEGIDHDSYQQTVEMKNKFNCDSNRESNVRTDDDEQCEGGGVSSEVIYVKNSQYNNNHDCSGSVVKSKGHLKTPKRNFIVQYFKRKSQSWSRNQFVTILILSFVEFFAAAVISIQAPFYPDVAREKGASATEYGLVFGIFEITVFIMSPIYGAKMDKLRPRRVFNWGILITGVCCVIFGLLNTIEGRAPFIWSCLIVRTVEAMGDAAFDTASFTIIAMEFPDSVATSFAILEICYGLGLIAGPTVGGALYQIGGYRLPFFAMGGFLFAAAIATYFFLPEPSERHQKRMQTKEAIPTGVPATGPGDVSGVPTAAARGGLHMFRMLKIPVIAMTAYSIVAATAGVGFISANLDYHLERFNLNKVALGAVFVMNGGVYAVTAPAWGWICDHTDHQKLITFTGSIFTILGFIFIGPIPYFPYDTTIPLSCFGLALFGFGLAATLVSAFLQVLNDAIAHGYPDDISTYGLVSGLWTSMSALGYFIGPSVGGVAVDWFGFRWSSVLIIGGQLILVLMLSAYYFARARSTVTSHTFRHEQDEAKIGEDAISNHNLDQHSIIPNTNLKAITLYSLNATSHDDGGVDKSPATVVVL